MIQLFGYTISALYPYALLGFPVGAAALFYTYRSLGASTAKVVSSLFLLRDLPRGVPGKQKFVPPPQFWFELFLILLLSLAASGLIAERTGQHIAIVVDRSLSVSSKDSQGKSRLSLLQEQAKVHINESDSTTRYSLFTIGASLSPVRGPAPSGHVTGARTFDESALTRDEALAALFTIESKVEQDKLPSGLEPLLTSNSNQSRFDAIWLYTDHPIEKTPSKNGELPLKITSLPSSGEKARSTNVWIIELSEVQNSLRVTVQATSPLAEISVLVSATCYGDTLQRPLPSPATRSLTLRPSATSPTDSGIVTLSPLPEGWRACKVSAERSDSDTTTDAIQQDNTAWIAKTSSKLSVALYSPLSPQELGLTRLETPQIYTAGTNAPTDERASIYHRVAAPQKQSKPTLIVLPPAQSDLWGGSISKEELTKVELSRWDASHPILQYVNVPTLGIPKARVISCPDTSTAVVSAREGAIVCAGSTPSGRYAIVSFELFPFEGRESPAVSILTLNILKWLIQDLSIDTRPSPPGFITPPPNTTKLNYLDPPREPLLLSTDSRVPLSGTSLVQFTDESGESLGYAASLFTSEYESDVRSESVITLPASPPQTGEKKNNRSPLWWLFALILLAALVADAVLKCLGKFRWEGR